MVMPLGSHPGSDIASPGQTADTGGGPAIQSEVVYDEVEKGPDLGGKIFRARIDREQPAASRRQLRQDQLQAPVCEVLLNQPLGQEGQTHTPEGGELQQGFIGAPHTGSNFSGLRSLWPVQSDASKFRATGPHQTEGTSSEHAISCEPECAPRMQSEGG